jgi:hypothetical protein
MARALKVYRTAIGFHDAYVATPTKKAALEAWGADRDLFASGRAELVTEPALTRAPLADAGKVIKVLRGTAAEQFAALEAASPQPARTRRPADAARPARSPAKAKAEARPTPRPSRAALDRAEKSLADTEARHDAALAKLARREADLRDERRRLERKRDADIAAREEARDHAKQAYDEALKEWRG